MYSQFIQSIIDEGPNDYSKSPFLRVRKNIIIDLITDRAERRGLHTLYHGKYVFEVVGGGKSVVFFQNAPENSVVATSITRDKTLTKKILTQHHLSVPKGDRFDDYESAAKYFSMCSQPQVVKPNAGATSRGVTVNITTLSQFEKAWANAFRDGEQVIVEDYFTGYHLRVFLIGGRAVGAYICLPAHVIGNGIDSIGAMIREKNKVRVRNPATMASKCSISRVDLLEASGYTIESVPPTGECVTLTGVVSIAAGGESIEVIRRINPSLLALAERAVLAIPGLHAAGVDMIVKDLTNPAVPDNAVILEINSNPALDDHVFPMYGTPVDIPDLLIDFVLRDERIGRKLGTGEFPEYFSSCEGKAFSRSYRVQMEIIKQAGYRRNLRVEEMSGVMFALKSEQQTIGFNQGMSDRTTLISRMASNRKDWAKRLLSAAGIDTPQGQSFTIERREAAWMFATELARPFVVKPRSGSGGSGVAVNISTRQHFEEAWDFALKTKPRAILIEEYFSANDFRLFVVGDQVHAAAQRVPAHVVGNGRQTVQELIDSKNRLRQANPYLGARLIKITSKIEINLEQQGIAVSTVLKDGQYLQLHSVANIGSGGESRDVSSIMHPEFAGIAIRASKAIFNAPCAGIGLLTNDIAKAPHEQRWMVIEVNTNPDLALHHFPHEGTARDAAGALLRYLFPETASSDLPAGKSTRLLIRGKVQGVGYRKWVWRKAHLHALSGWIRNLADGRVEAVFRGAPNAVENMILLCRAGPAGAVIQEIVDFPFDGTTERGFVVREDVSDTGTQIKSDVSVRE